MRNLKRVLSLTLASVMLFGMMVIGSSAAEVKKIDFTDANEIENTEAVNVMVALGVLEGNPDGGFNPKGTLTREQAAKIICYMLLGADNAEKLTANKDVFTDVAANRWSAGYISYCVERNILAGNGNGSFNPTGELTGTAFGKMLLVALGYDPAIQGYTGSSWALSVAADMVDAGIAPAGVLLSAPMTREQAAQAAFQTLTADVVRYTQKPVTVTNADGSTVVVGAGETIAVSNDKRDDYRTKEDDWDDKQQFCEKYFTKLKLDNDEAQDDFLRPGSEWQLNNDKICFTADDTALTYTKETKLSDIYKDLGKPNLTGGKLTFVKNGDDTAKDNSGNTVALSSSATGKIGAKGTLVEVYKDGKDVTIIAIDTYLVKATSDYSEKNEELSVTPHGVTLDSSKIKNEDVTVSNFVKDDLILVTGLMESGRLTVKTAELADKVEEVKVSAYKGTKDSVTAGGTKYEYNAQTAYDPDSAIDAYNLQKTSYDLILDNYGYVIGVEKHSDEVTLDDILFVKDADKSGFNWLAKVIFMDGSEKTVTIAGTQKADGSSYEEITDWVSSTENSTAALTADGEISEKRFFEFNEKSNGEYELKDIADTRQAKATATGDDAKKNIVGGEVQPIRSTASETPVAKTANNSTIFIAKDTVYTGVKNSPSVSNADVYYLLDNDSQNYILAAYTAKKGVSTVDVSEYVYVFSGNGRGQDDDDNTYYTYTAIKDGEKLDGSFQAATNSKPTGLYQIETYEDGYPVLGTALTTHDDDVYTYATVGAKTNITYKNGVVTAGKGFMMADDAQVYVVDVADKSVDVIAPSSADKDSLDDGNYAVCAVYESTSSKDVKVLWLIKGSNGKQAVYTSGTVTKATTTTKTAITIAGVEVEVTPASTTVAQVATELGKDSSLSAWTVADSTNDIVFEAKTAGAFGSTGAPTGAPSGLTDSERTAEGKDAVKASGSVTLTTAGDTVTIDGTTLAYDSISAVSTATETSGKAYKYTITVDNTDKTIAFEAATAGASGNATVDSNATVGGATGTAVKAENGANAVKAKYTVTGVNTMISGATSSTSGTLTIGDFSYTVTSDDLATQLTQWKTAFDLTNNATWTVAIKSDDNSITFTAKTAGDIAGPTGTTLVTKGENPVAP